LFKKKYAIFKGRSRFIGGGFYLYSVKKIVLLGFVFILFAKVTIAQQDLLSFDEHNKYIYYQVITMAGLPADSLHDRGLYFFKKAYPKTTLKSVTATGVEGDGKFLVYDGVSVLKHEKGEITYQVNIEFKDQKYRFWLTNFIFTPYVRDRYANFVPQQGIYIPLEDALAKLDKTDVAGYLNETGAFCKQLEDKLKLYMLRLPEPKKEEPVKKIVTDKW
jgi:hypothetical protein